MEHDQESSDSAVVRRRRKISRPVREKTPEPGLSTRRNYSDESSSNFEPVQTVRMQIRPPATISAHESKILRRRDKTFASAASRSHSQPRQAERLSSPEAHDLIKAVEKRSLSSPRHKEERSEGERYATSPDIFETNLGSPTRLAKSRLLQKEEEHLSRLDRNLRRFEDERRRFELEKRVFEKEKREYKIRYKQYLDAEERKRLMENYKKLCDRTKNPQDVGDKRTVLHSLKLSKKETPVRFKENSLRYESSSPVSSSESEAMKKDDSRNHRSLSSKKAPIQTEEPPPPPVPLRRNVSRNNSLSPIRPSRRCKTPEITTNHLQTSSIEDKIDLVDKLQLVNIRKNSGELLIENENGLSEKSLEHKRSLVSAVDSLKLIQKESSESSVVPNKEKNDFLLGKTTQKGLTQPTIISTIITYFKRPKLSKDTPLYKEHLLFNKAFYQEMNSELINEWRKLKAEYPQELDAISKLRNKCFINLIVLTLLCGFGGLMFRYTEGSFENIYKCEVRKVKRDFIDYLWTVSHNMREDDWKSAARTKLRTFEEELLAMQERGLRRYPGMKSWNFVNCVMYCWTVITTIGYGHITPKTVMGRSLTVVYAIIGIPMFLILLADFGKLFTRAIKFVWSYVRRIYYTGTCRKVRKQQQVLDVISGFNTMYDYAVRRPSHFIYGESQDEEAAQSALPCQVGQQGQSPTPLPNKLSSTAQTPMSHVPSHPETPTSAYPETFEIDDEFNLPISVASLILVFYILTGAFVYTLWERNWSYFEAFYFVFISMSTIGFGDLVPEHPIFMMCSIVYLIFGLALTSMFINVVQIKLSDTFKGASAKIGATIGLTMADGSESQSVVPTPSDIVTVHMPKLGPIGENYEDLSQNNTIYQQPRSSIPNPAPALQKKGSEEKITKKKGFFK